MTDIEPLVIVFGIWAVIIVGAFVVFGCMNAYDRRRMDRATARDKARRDAVRAEAESARWEVEQRSGGDGESFEVWMIRRYLDSRQEWTTLAKAKVGTVPTAEPNWPTALATMVETAQADAITLNSIPTLPS